MRILHFAAAAAVSGVACMGAFGEEARADRGCLPAEIKSKLAQIESRFGTVTVVSTFRRGARIAGTGHLSYHASCRAVDFHPPKGKYSAVLAWLQANHGGGLGTYTCGMHHLHIDNGPNVRFNHCVTANGTPIGKSRVAARRRATTRVALAAKAKAPATAKTKVAARTTKARVTAAASTTTATATAAVLPPRAVARAKPARTALAVVALPVSKTTFYQR